MNKRYKDAHGKAIKWKRTRYGVKYFRLQLAKQLLAAGMCASAIAQIKTIQAQPAKTKIKKVNKAIEIASVVIEANVQTLKIMRGEAQWNH